MESHVQLLAEDSDLIMKVVLFFVAAWLSMVAARTTETETGILVHVQGTHTVELAVEGDSAFRVSVSYDSNIDAGKIETTMVDDHATNAKYAKVQKDGYVGIQTDFGSVLINPDTDAFEMLDANGQSITSAAALSKYKDPTQVSGSVAKRPLRGIGTRPAQEEVGESCDHPLPNRDVSSGVRVPDFPNGLTVADQGSCCMTCHNNTECAVWIFAAKGHESGGINCWLMKDVHTTVPATFRSVGGKITPPPPVEDTLTLTLSSTEKSKFYGAGSGGQDATTLSRTNSNPSVANTQFYVPYYYSSDGYSALGVSSYTFSENDYSVYPASWDYYSPSVVQWSVGGKTANLYLMPATSMADGLSKYWDLSGRPAVPPRYAFGFLACRWGWKDADSVLETLKEFRSGNYPVDAWISDFEWYTPEPDYNLPDAGSPTFKDFSYDPRIFPDPVNQLSTYHGKDLNLRFGGIRKPRLGNSDSLVMAKEKGWLVDPKAGTGSAYNARDLNYSIPAVREWYADQMSHFLRDGVDFWWNDEGESSYFNFFYWNDAQKAMLAAFDKMKRFWTINRSFSPGMQRQGSLTWTGDIPVEWDALRNTPGYVLNWELAGTGFITCDTGGFSGDDVSGLLLSRWYQVAAFMPIMRVHSKLGNTAHFPFNYAPDAAAAMQKALNLRYMFVPYHYSLAHHMNDPAHGGKPIMRPLIMNYPDDESVLEMTSEWLDGDGLLVAPIMNENNASTVYLPAGLWYTFNDTKTYTGPYSLPISNAALDDIPLFAKSGSVIPLAPLVQYTDALPGGPLEVQVYAGADGSFALVEDDGETYAYTGADKSTRVTTFEWDDAKKTLSWTVTGSFAGNQQSFSQVFLKLFAADGAPKSSKTVALGKSGHLSL